MVHLEPVLKMAIQWSIQNMSLFSEHLSYNVLSLPRHAAIDSSTTSVTSLT